MLLNSTRRSPAFGAIRHLLVEYLLTAAHVRPPLTPVPSAERDAIRQALVASGMLEHA